MLRSDDRRKIIRGFDHDSASVVAVMLKCAGGLLIIACVALLGAKTDLGRDVAPDRPQAQRPENASLAHSKRLYEERRARFESSQEATGMTIRSGLSNPATAAGMPEPVVDEETLLRRARD